MTCGHPRELAIFSAETGQFLFCDLCDCRAQRNDALKMEAKYRADLAQVRKERDAAREALREIALQEGCCKECTHLARAALAGPTAAPAVPMKGEAMECDCDVEGPHSCTRRP